MVVVVIGGDGGAALRQRTADRWYHVQFQAVVRVGTAAAAVATALAFDLLVVLHRAQRKEMLKLLNEIKKLVRSKMVIYRNLRRLPSGKK